MKSSVKHPPAEPPDTSLKAIFGKLIQDNAVLMAAGLAFFSIFALAPSLIIVIAVSGLVLGKMSAETQILLHAETMLGPDVAAFLRGLIHGIHYSGAGKTTILSSLLLFVGASGLFVQLKAALNHVWDVPHLPGSFLKKHLKNRMRGIFFVIMAGLMLVFLVSINAVAWFFYHHVAPLLPVLAGRQFWIFRIINTVTAFCALTLFSVIIFRYLPDVKMHWLEAWRGALVTAGLLMVGLFLVGSYLGRANFRSVFGVAGSVVALLIWVYVSALIFLFGAEVTWFLNQRLKSPAA